MLFSFHALPCVHHPGSFLLPHPSSFTFHANPSRILRLIDAATVFLSCSLERWVPCCSGNLLLVPVRVSEGFYEAFRSPPFLTFSFSVWYSCLFLVFASSYPLSYISLFFLKWPVEYPILSFFTSYTISLSPHLSPSVPYSVSFFFSSILLFIFVFSSYAFPRFLASFFPLLFLLHHT